MKIIMKYPILAALLFIVLFEMIFQHNMMLLLYFGLIYVTLKTTGATKMIKNLAFASYKKILRWLTNKPKPIDVIFTNEYGQVEGNFYVKELGEYYLIKAIRDRKKKMVTIRVTKVHAKKKDMRIINAPDFYINRDTVLKYLQENHFNQD
jgi:hypothetical protein